MGHFIFGDAFVRSCPVVSCPRSLCVRPLSYRLCPACFSTYAGTQNIVRAVRQVGFRKYTLCPPFSPTYVRGRKGEKGGVWKLVVYLFSDSFCVTKSIRFRECRRVNSIVGTAVPVGSFHPVRDNARKLGTFQIFAISSRAGARPWFAASLRTSTQTVIASSASAAPK